MHIFLERSIKHFCNMTFVLTLLTMPTTETLRQPQLILKSTNTDIFSSKFTSYIRSFKLLELPHKCFSKNLEACHTNETQNDLYYEDCFRNVCAKNNYYCINGNGYTLHICGVMPNCERRFRNVVEFNITHADVVDVYSILCPDGYFQFSLGNCFKPCLKDKSVVVIRNSTAQRHAQGYCNNENNYCNPNGLTVFELASKNDKCVKGVSVESTKCGQPDELLPNCSCSSRCPHGQTRSWSSDFSCGWIQNLSTLHSSTVTELSAHHTQKSDVTDAADDQERKEVQMHLDDKITIITIIISAVVAVVTVTALVIVVLALIWFMHSHCGCHKHAKLKRHNTEPIEMRPLRPENDLHTGPVTITKKKTVVNTTVINRTREVNIQNDNDIPSEASEETGPMNSEPQ